ncbi:unnamed protein product [Symbiodinium necroappetens]|uniref:Uncharacterized protein n=1 Tax=Symbiodinium necroappetens TaxID=1628268 RepID=A0A812SPF9_9DINO|nr:unnamed protein product [Symbiodinium necroappetens]
MTALRVLVLVRAPARAVGRCEANGRLSAVRGTFKEKRKTPALNLLRPIHSVHSPAGCSMPSSLVHRLRQSRRNASLDSTPLSFMHVGPHPHAGATKQISLALFNLVEHRDESAIDLNEDQAGFLRPLLPVVGAWREKCVDSDGKLLLLLPGSQIPPGTSLWDVMATEFAAFLARKAPCYSAMAVLRGDAFSKAWSQRFRCDIQDARLVRHFVNVFMQKHEVTAATDDEKAQVCYRGPQLSNGVDLALRHCRLQGKEVNFQVLSRSATAEEASRCTVLLHAASAKPIGAEKGGFLAIVFYLPFCELFVGTAVRATPASWAFACDFWAELAARPLFFPLWWRFATLLVKAAMAEDDKGTSA